MHTGPVIVASMARPPRCGPCVRPLPFLPSRAALAVVVWEAGRRFQAATLPEKVLELPPATLDIRTAFEAEKAAYDAAQRLAEHGAALAREAGLRADGLAAADDVTVADSRHGETSPAGAPAAAVSGLPAARSSAQPLICSCALATTEAA